MIDMTKKSLFQLLSVRKSDCPFLFELLKERESKAKISHRKMPTYNNHVKFVMSKPYAKWYIIKNQDERIGSVYLSNQDEIGISLKKVNQGNGVGKIILELLMKKNPRKRYLANINPKNGKLIRFFEKNQFKLLQYTYELRK